LKFHGVYDAIVQYYTLYSVPPTQRRLGELTGLKSTDTVTYYLRRLVAMGLITMVDRHPVPVEISKYLQKYTPEGVKS
jgi:SOS-response transcriptional repressor LexA